MRLSSQDAATLASQLFDPRGRCDRRGFLFLAVGLMIAQVVVATAVSVLGHAVNGPLFLSLNAPLFWVGFMAVLKRLHDIGKSGWWAPAAIAFWGIGAVAVSLITLMAVGAPAFERAVLEQTAIFWGLIAMMWVPAFGALLWLHASAGSAGANRFGAVPGVHGFAPGPARPQSGSPAADMPAGAASAH